MIINLNNTSGYTTKRVKLSDDFYMLKLLYNYRDASWYLSIPDYIDNKRIVKDRIIFETEYGYLTTDSPVGKTTFTTLEWIEV